jgi:uncharacterized protein (TIGR03437 family)
MALGYAPREGDPEIGAVAVAGSDGEQRISAGALVTISGLRLGEVTASPAVPLKRVLGDTFVAVEGVRAPILDMSPERIEVQIPWDIPVGPASIAVSVNGALSAPRLVESRLTTPVIYGVLHADGLPVTAEYPLSKGETVAIYATGLGAVNMNLDSGATGPLDPLAATVVKPDVRVGEAAMEVTFSGLAPGFVGLYQVNAIAPDSLVEGQDVKLTLSAAGMAASVDIAVP